MSGAPSDLGDPMRVGTHNGHLMVAALKRHRDKPVIHLGETTLTGGEVSQRISQYVQAFEALDAGSGTAGALLALNRPEVLFILGASQTQGYRRTSLHPLGSLDDHAYVINDAEITTLIVDPVFTERALGLLEKCPGLKHVLTIGPNGRIKAEVFAKAVIVLGEITGNVTASEKVDIRDKGSVDGDIVAPRVAIAEGAHFRGSVDMQRAGGAKGAQPKADQKPAAAAQAQQKVGV